MQGPDLISRVLLVVPVDHETVQPACHPGVGDLVSHSMERFRRLSSSCALAVLLLMWLFNLFDVLLVFFFATVVVFCLPPAIGVFALRMKWGLFILAISPYEQRAFPPIPYFSVS